MRYFFLEQQQHFPKYLEQLRSESIMDYSIDDLKEKRSFIRIDTPRVLSDIDLNFLFDYNIFPGNIMAHLTQWKYENRKIRVGDTILQQVYLPPFPFFSQKLIIGVRIIEIIDEPHRKGFTYATLDGHVEKGISTFTLESDRAAGILFSIHTYSKPATLITKMVATIISLPYQTYCTAAALRNVKRLIEGVC